MRDPKKISWRNPEKKESQKELLEKSTEALIGEFQKKLQDNRKNCGGNIRKNYRNNLGMYSRRNS